MRTINEMTTTRVGLLLVCLLWTAAVRAQEDDPSLDSLDDLRWYDVNGKLAGHHLVIHPACVDLRDFTSPLYRVHEAKGPLLRQLFSSDDDDDEDDVCRAACIQRGTDRDVVTAVMPHLRYDASTTTSSSFSDWFQRTCASVESCFMNYHTDRDDVLELYWIPPPAGDDDDDKSDDDAARGRKHMDIRYGERHTRCFNTFLGHRFVALTRAGETVGDVVTMEFATVLAFGESPPSDDVGRHRFDEEIENTLHSEWTRHQRVSRTFSPLGFARGRLPDDVFAFLAAFYYNNRHHKVVEEWQGKGVFVNWWESDVYFIQIPWEMKKLVQRRLLDMVGAWAGVDVEQTVMYGLRQYETGARLLTHVDRHVTHAVSLIVNVAQGNLTEPWPVEVQDHADRLHEVVMAPGDVVYYESAKALHARNRPLRGDEGAYYVNLFTHYRPVGDDQWYRRPNPPGTPEPVLEDDVQGTCRLVPRALTTVDDHNDDDNRPQQLGVVETVECDDARLGHSVSPTFFQAREARDLVHWWRYTNPHMDHDTTELHTWTTTTTTDDDEETVALRDQVERLTQVVDRMLEERTTSKVSGHRPPADADTSGNDEL